MISSILRAAYAKLERHAPDVVSAHLRFFRTHRRFARLAAPRSFSDFVTRRALFDRDERFPRLADKIEAKQVVSRLLGPAWTIPSLFEGERLPDREARQWPLPYVIKASHGSNMNLFIRNAADLDWDKIEAIVDGWLATRFSRSLRERLYDDIRPRLLVEPLIGDPAALPTDIKFFCFAGRWEYAMVQSDRAEALRIAVMDRDWLMLPLRYSFPQPAQAPKRPETLAALAAAAETLAAPFDFVRMDFYDIDGAPLFGEFTFTPGGGVEIFDPYRFNLEFGSRWRTAARARRKRPTKA